MFNIFTQTFLRGVCKWCRHFGELFGSNLNINLIYLPGLPLKDEYVCPQTHRNKNAPLFVFSTECAG